MKLFPALLLVALAAGSTGCVIHVKNHGLAEAGGRWDKLGEQSVDFNVDKDSIPVTASEGLFRAIRLRADNAPVEMLRVEVVFADGSTFSPEVKQVLQPGESTRRIDLPGNKRVIQQVNFAYRSLQPIQGRGRIELYGQR